jgi:NAD(P)H-nitrite reductase large subunit
VGLRCLGYNPDVSNSDSIDKSRAITRDGSNQDPQRTICFCHCVSYEVLVAAIRGGAVTHAQIQDITSASTGCGGCEVEVLEILEEELVKLAKERAKT